MRAWPTIRQGTRTRPSFWTGLQDAVDEIEGGEVPLPLAGIEGALGEWLPVFDPRGHGAACDGVTDDTAAWQSMFDAIAAVSPRSGGRVLLTGHSRTTAPIIPKCENLTIVGLARRSLRTYPVTPALAGAPPTIISDHTGPAFKLSHQYPINGMALQDISLIRTGSKTSDTIALDFDLAGDGAFMRDFSLRRVTIMGFHSAITARASSAEGTGSSSQIGLLHVFDCNIQYNTWISQCFDGIWWNGFYFLQNDAGQNGYLEGQGGIAVAGHNISIVDNVLEGQRDPVKVSLIAGRSCQVRGNYFEQNVGLACVDIVGQIGPVDIGPNFYGTVFTTHKALLRDGTGGGQCLDRWWPSGAMKVHPLPNTIVGVTAELSLGAGQLAERPWSYLDSPSDEHLGVPKEASAIRADVTSDPYPAPTPFGSPGYGKSMPVQLATLTSTGRITYSYSGYGGTLGEILVATFCYRLPDDRGTDEIYVQLSPDADPSKGFDGTIALETRYFRADEWRMLTVGIAPTASWTNLTIGLYPYGLNASGVTGKTVLHKNPTVYKPSSVNGIQPYIKHPFAASAAPTNGAWELGDQIINSAPSASGAALWVCTAAGTPGTWKAVNLES